jgi:glycosyltransferase involved in cell wall biosynthesis
MACGSPVAVSTIPPLEEVCGDAAVYFDPTDPAAIANGILSALAGGGVRAGIDRASAFTWAASARAHDAAYRDLLDLPQD